MVKGVDYVERGIVSDAHLNHMAAKADCKIQRDGSVKQRSFLTALWLKQQNTTNNDDLRCRSRIESEHILVLKMIKVQKEHSDFLSKNPVPQVAPDALKRKIAQSKEIKSAMNRHDYRSTHPNPEKASRKFLAEKGGNDRANHNDGSGAVPAKGRLPRPLKVLERVSRAFHAMGDAANGITTVSGTFANSTVNPTSNPKSVATKIRMVLGAVVACCVIMVSGKVISNFIGGDNSLANQGLGVTHKMFNGELMASFFVGWFWHSMAWYGLASIGGLITMMVSSLSKAPDLQDVEIEQLGQKKDVTLTRLFDYIQKVRTDETVERIVIAGLGKKISGNYRELSNSIDCPDTPKLWNAVRNVESVAELEEALATYLSPTGGCSDSYRRERHVLALTNLVEHQRIPGVKDAKTDRTGRMALQEAPLGGLAGGYGLRKMAGRALVGLGNLTNSTSLVTKGKGMKAAADTAMAEGRAARAANDSVMQDPAKEFKFASHNHKILQNKDNYGFFTRNLARGSEGVRFLAQAVVLSLDTNVGRVFGATFEKIADCMGSHPNRIMARRVGMFFGMALIGTALSFLSGGFTMVFDASGFLLGKAGGVEWRIAGASLAFGCGGLLLLSLLLHGASRLAMMVEGHVENAPTRVYVNKGAKAHHLKNSQHAFA